MKFLDEAMKGGSCLPEARVGEFGNVWLAAVSTGSQVRVSVNSVSCVTE